MAARTARDLSALTLRLPDMTWDTVVADTPAALATSSIDGIIAPSAKRFATVH
jgi:hypothetical protein